MRGMVLAAGFGTRLQPLSHVRPKALLPCFSFPLIELVLHHLRPAVNGSILINLHHGALQLERFLRDYDDITLLPESVILGTGGGIANACRNCPGEELLVHNVDIISDIDLVEVATAYQENPSYALLLLHYHPDFLQVFTDGDRITGFGHGGALAYTGIMILSPQASQELAATGQFNIIDFFQDAIARRRDIRGLTLHPGCWIDAGRAAHYLRFHRRYFADDEFRLLINRILPGPPNTTGNSFTGSEVEVDDNCELSDSVIWDRVRIRRGPIREAVLADGVTVAQPVYQAMVI
ncbi:MAG: NDP-sugar synthase [Candidatus Delongbacteria bacterium]|nr:NDP-sugar synthase [Candidatus Delongbacteria bacterium]